MCYIFMLGGRVMLTEMEVLMVEHLVVMAMQVVAVLVGQLQVVEALLMFALRVQHGAILLFSAEVAVVQEEIIVTVLVNHVDVVALVVAVAEQQV